MKIRFLLGAIVLCLVSSAGASPGPVISPILPDRGDVTISGSVAEKFELILPTTAYKGDIATSGMTQWVIGAVKVYSNFNSWTFSVSSKNGETKAGFLMHESDPSETISYTFSLGSLTPKRAGLPWQSSVQVKTPKAGSEYQLSVYFMPDDVTFYEPGVYSDVLILTITKN